MTNKCDYDEKIIIPCSGVESISIDDMHINFKEPSRSKMSFKEWNEKLNEEICKTFSVDKFYMSSPGVIDPSIEAINSSEPDILDENTSYRKERRVN